MSFTQHGSSAGRNTNRQERKECEVERILTDWSEGNVLGQFRLEIVC